MQVNVDGTWRNPDRLEEVSSTSLGESQRYALEFIRAWNSGKSFFEFRTSGSTGDPKPITFSRSSLESSALFTIRALGLKPGMNSLVCLDTRFVAGAMMLVRALMGHMNLILREPSSDPLKDLNITVDFAAFVPLQLNTCLQHSRVAFGKLSAVIIGGAPVDDAFVSALPAESPRIYATYGMTETLTHIALRKLNGADRQPCFYPLPGIRIEKDERGCLVIHASHLGDVPVVTNDLATFTPDGGFHILGRADEVINSGGYKVHPRTVESAAGRILRDLGIQVRIFVAGVSDPQLHQRVCLVVESQPLPPTVESALRDRLPLELKKFELPREIIYRDRFVETATQKIDKRATLGL